jgi:glucosylceramidase
VTIDSQSKEVTHSGQYHAFAHYSRCIRRGARRFSSEGAIAGIAHVACENADGQKVLVVTNSGPARIIKLRLGESVTDLACQANSIATLVWA